MTPDRLKRIEEVFFSVATLPPEKRAVRLDALCAGDAELRTEVGALLQHESRVAGFLEEPAVALSGSGLDPGSVADELIGVALGPWKIERQIASGGMGTVYLGSRADGQYQQQVAIKVVKRGMDSEELLKRFRRERRTLAALNHPNIARLLDGGLAPDGRPYLVMEYVPGLPIDVYCDRKRLNLEERLRVFRVVCEAVRAAHRNLVVHRDLKPGNILVTEDGTPKLLDFGIAKLVGGPDATRTLDTERRLTPEYASPEQAAGLPLTTATDVYSLGVILYQLLCGRLPYRFHTKTSGEIERVIRNQPPTPPSGTGTRLPWGTTAEIEPADLERTAENRQSTSARLRRALRGDLDNIVLMALRKEPERRYPSVEQLDSDIERYLTGLPVFARPDTFRYRTGKFIRRHSLAVALSAGAALVLLLAVAAITWQGQVAVRQRNAAYLARDQAEQVVEFLRRMLASADPAEGRNVTVRTILDRTAIAIEGDLANQPLVQATVRSAIGHSYIALGLLDEAEKHIRAAYEQRLAILGPDHHDMAESKIDLGELLYVQGKYDESETLLLDALEMHRRQRGLDNPDTGRVLNDLGAVQRARGKIDEAEASHKEALRIRRLAYGDESLPVAESLNNIAGVLSARNDAPGAIEACEEGLRLRRKLLSPEHPLVFQSLSNLAVMQGRAGRLEQAEQLLVEAAALGERALGVAHLDVGRTLSSLGGVRMLLGKWTDAEADLRRAVEILDASLAPGHHSREAARANLGRCLIRLDRNDEAATLLAGALEALKGSDGKVPRGQIPALDDLIALYEELGDRERADAARAWRADEPPR